MTVPVFLALFGLVVLWASAFPVIKVGLDGLGVLHLTLLRHLVASLCFLPFLALTRQRLFPDRRDILPFVLLGSVGIAVYHTALNAGELRVSAGATSLIIAAAPAITALLARLFLGDRLPLLGWVGSVLSFCGIAVIVLGDSASLGFDPYALLILLSALAAASYFVWQKPFHKRYRAVEVTAFATWGGTLPMLAFFPGLGADVTGAGNALLAAVYLGVFPSAIAYSLLGFALSRTPVTLVSAYLYTIPLFALLFSWLLLGEIPSLLTVAGGAVTIAGIVLVNLVKTREARLSTARQPGIRTGQMPPDAVSAAAPRMRRR
ncbi:MAG: DMT family transporter [Trueperaceae bacterium]